MANYNVKVDNIEKPVTDLNKKFDNITKEFKTVRDKLRDNKEELTRRRQENLEAKTQLTKMEIFTNNYPIIVFVNAWNYMKYQLQSSTKTSERKFDRFYLWYESLQKKTILPSATDSK